MDTTTINLVDQSLTPELRDELTNLLCEAQEIEERLAAWCERTYHALRTAEQQVPSKAADVVPHEWEHSLFVRLLGAIADVQRHPHALAEGDAPTVLPGWWLAEKIREER